MYWRYYIHVTVEHVNEIFIFFVWWYDTCVWIHFFFSCGRTIKFNYSWITRFTVFAWAWNVFLPPPWDLSLVSAFPSSFHPWDKCFMYMYKTFHPKKEKLLNMYIQIIIIIKKLGEKKKEIEITRDDHLIGAGGFIYLFIYLFIWIFEEIGGKNFCWDYTKFICLCKCLKCTMY